MPSLVLRCLVMMVTEDTSDDEHSDFATSLFPLAVMCLESYTYCYIFGLHLWFA